ASLSQRRQSVRQRPTDHLVVCQQLRCRGALLQGGHSLYHALAVICLGARIETVGRKTMALNRILRACTWALAATLAVPAAAFAQSHPEFVPLGRVSAALYKPDSGPAPHIAFLVSHRTGNNLNNSACKELAK